MATKITLQEGEARSIKITIGGTFTLTGGTFTCAILAAPNPSTPLVTIADGSMNKDEIASRIVYAPLTAAQTKTTLGAGRYYLSLKIVVGGNTYITKSNKYEIEIEDSYFT